MAPFESFLKFVAGFTVFISVSFGVTYLVSSVEEQEAAKRQTAAALEAMLRSD
jgi:hypothetical protein